jgi:uncharacterized membrane protein
LVTRLKNKGLLLLPVLALIASGGLAHASDPDYAAAATSAAGSILTAITDMAPIILGVVASFIAFGVAKKMLKKAS